MHTTRMPYGVPIKGPFFHRNEITIQKFVCETEIHNLVWKKKWNKNSRICQRTIKKSNSRENIVGDNKKEIQNNKRTRQKNVELEQESLFIAPHDILILTLRPWIIETLIWSMHWNGTFHTKKLLNFFIGKTCIIDSAEMHFQRGFIFMVPILIMILVNLSMPIRI